MLLPSTAKSPNTSDRFLDLVTEKSDMKIGKFVLLVVTMLACEWTAAAEITVVSTVGVKGVLERVRQDFEHSGAYSLNIQYGTSAALKRQLDDGESFDLAILT